MEVEYLKVAILSDFDETIKEWNKLAEKGWELVVIYKFNAVFKKIKN
jgi:hypothetical protein